MSIPGTFGPFLGGFLFEQFSYAVVFGSKLLCHLTTIFYIVFFLPSPKLASSSAAATAVAPEDSISGGGFQAETTTSLKREKKSSSSVIRTSVRFTFSEVFSLSHIVKSFRVCFVDRPKAQRTRLILLFVMAFVVMVVSAGKNKKVQWKLKKGFKTLKYVELRREILFHGKNISRSAIFKKECKKVLLNSFVMMQFS